MARFGRPHTGVLTCIAVLSAGAAGLDAAKLKRDGFYRAVVGDDLFLLGRDHKRRWVSNLKGARGTA